MNKQISKYKMIVYGLSCKWQFRLLSVLVSSIFLFGIPEYASAQNRLIELAEFGGKEGALNGIVTKFVQDRDGFIWTGTTEGLSRFDGSSFEHFQHDPEDPTSIADNEIITICSDKITGEIWIAHEKGLSVFLPEKKAFRNYLLKKDNPNGLPNNRAMSIFIDDTGLVWLGFNSNRSKTNSLYQYKRAENRFEKITFQYKEETAPIYYYSVVEIQQDIFDKEKLWLCSSHGLMSFHKKDKTVSNYWIPKSERNGSFNRRITLCQMQNGNIYASFPDNGMFLINRTTRNYTRIEHCEETKEPVFKEGMSAYLYPNSDYDFWITSRKSTSLYDVSSGCITYTKRTKGKRKKNISRVDFIDQQNRIWSRGSYRGFHIYNPLKLNNYGFEHLVPSGSGTRRLPGRIERISIDEIAIVYRLYIGLEIINLTTGKNKIIGPSEESRTKKNTLNNPADMRLLQDGSILLYNSKKLFLYRKGLDTLTQILLPIKGQSIQDIIQDKDGRVWMTHFYRLYQLDMENYTFKSYTNDIRGVRKKESIFSGGGDLAEDKYGNIHMLDYNGLLTFLKKENRFVYQDYGFELEGDYSSRTKTDSKQIKSDEKGNVFILLDGQHLGCVNLEALESKPITFYDVSQNGTKANVETFIPFGDSLIFIRENGVQFFNSKCKELDSDFSFGKTFDQPIRRASLLDNNQVAILRKYGYFHFNPLQLKSTKSSLDVYLKHFKVRGVEEKVSALINDNKQLKLDPEENFFSLKFAVKKFDFADKTTFRYKLSGIDKNWQVGTPNEFIRYTKVPGGSYPFIIESIEEDGKLIGETTIATIHIAIPWWESLWFRILAICSVLALVAFAYKRRIDRALKEERRSAEVKKLVAEAEMAALRAQMNPHFIFNSLNSIDYYIIKKDQETASDYLNRFSRLIRLVLKNSQQEKVSLKEDLEALQLYIQLERLRFKNAFEYNISIADDLNQDQLKIPPMLIQPYVENAIWHGLMQQKHKPGKLLLKIYKENNFLNCHIEDNGIGREAAMARKSKSGSKQKSFGMKITGDRLALLNTDTDTASAATVAIIDLKNEDGTAAGTRVELKIPLA